MSQFHPGQKVWIDIIPSAGGPLPTGTYAGVIVGQCTRIPTCCGKPTWDVKAEGAPKNYCSCENFITPRYDPKPEPGSWNELDDIWNPYKEIKHVPS